MGLETLHSAAAGDRRFAKRSIGVLDGAWVIAVGAGAVPPRKPTRRSSRATACMSSVVPGAWTFVAVAYDAGAPRAPPDRRRRLRGQRHAARGRRDVAPDRRRPRRRFAERRFARQGRLLRRVGGPGVCVQRGTQAADMRYLWAGRDQAPMPPVPGSAAYALFRRRRFQGSRDDGRRGSRGPGRRRPFRTERLHDRALGAPRASPASSTDAQAFGLVDKAGAPGKREFSCGCCTSPPGPRRVFGLRLWRVRGRPGVADAVARVRLHRAGTVVARLRDVVAAPRRSRHASAGSPRA